MYAGPVAPAAATSVYPLVVFAGRHVKEKRLPLLVRGFAAARRDVPDLRLEVFGDGPDRAAAEAEAARLDVHGAVSFRGRRPQNEVEHAFAHAACVATASEREGYGLVVVEAAARGTPSVVVAGPENAAVELVADGVNGAVAEGSTPESVGAAIVKAVRGGPALRASTIAWFHENADGLRIERSIELVTRAYAGGNR